MPLDGSITRKRRFTIRTSGPTPAVRCLYRLYGGTCARTGRTAHRLCEFHHRHIGAYGQSGKYEGGAYTPPLKTDAVFRRDAYLCLYCGARFPYSLLSRDMSLLAAAARHLAECRVGLPSSITQASAHPGTGGHAAFGRAVHADLCRIHIPEGAPRAGGSNGNLVAHFPRSSPLHERMQRWPM